MPQVVWRPERNGGGAARLRDRRPQRVRTRTGEQACTGVAILARAELGLERIGERRVQLHPQRLPRLRRRRAQADAPARLVVVAHERQIDRGDAGTAPVEPEHRQPVLEIVGNWGRVRVGEVVAIEYRGDPEFTNRDGLLVTTGKYRFTRRPTVGDEPEGDEPLAATEEASDDIPWDA